MIDFHKFKVHPYKGRHEERSVVQIKQQELMARKKIVANPVKMDAIKKKLQEKTAVKAARRAAKAEAKAAKKAAKKAKKDKKRKKADPSSSSDSDSAASQDDR